MHRVRNEGKLVFRENRFAFNIKPADAQHALGRAQDRSKGPQGGGFAGPVGAYQTHDLPWPHFEAKLVDSSELTVVFSESCDFDNVGRRIVHDERDSGRRTVSRANSRKFT